MRTPRLFVTCALALTLAACSSTSSRAPLAASDALAFAPPSLAHALPPQDAEVDAEAEPHPDRGFFGHLAWWLPNRLLDVFDIVRVRLRLGPGFGVGVRATELADVYLGSYVSVYLGLPGPRGEPKVNWPVGFESKTGAEISAAEATVEGQIGPNYGPFEFGLGAQVLLVGLDIGIEPFEIVDFAVGLLTFDPVGDDF